LEENTQLRKSVSPGKRSVTSASKKSVKKSVAGGNAVATTTTKAKVVDGGAVSTQYEQRGLIDGQVNAEHLQTMEGELKRERQVTTSV